MRTKRASAASLLSLSAFFLSRSFEKISTISCGSMGLQCAAWHQGLTLVHFSAQRKHFLQFILGGFSDKNGSG